MQTCIKNNKKMEKEKYYTPTIEELNVNQEVYLLDTGNYKASYSEGDIYPMLVTITQLTDYPTIWVKTKGTDNYNKIYEVYPDQIGLKYLDREDIESFGFKKRLKDEWIGWKDYALDTISGEIPYFLSVTIHIPRMDDCYKIYLHRYLDEGIKLEDRINEGESELVYKGKIKNKSEFSRLLKQLSII